MNLDELFPEEDFRLQLTLRRTDPPAFFGAREPSGRLLAERARLLAVEPHRYAAVTDDAEALIDEFESLAGRWPIQGGAAYEAERSPSGLPRMVRIGSIFEPDLLFLSADTTGAFRLRAGALCFPTGWALGEKIGLTLDEIHGVVPGLNAAVGPAIQQFLSRLKPGIAFLRDNWGLAATDELNLHPVKRTPAPTLPLRMDRLWLRVEHQALLALPRTRGVLFGIRIALHRMDDVAQHPAAPRVRRALETMPSELATYKRIDAVRQAVIRAL